MNNPRTTIAYKAYYDNVLSKNHNNPELIGRWGADPGSFETQIMCHKMGMKVPDSNMYESDGEIFGPSRWPYNAAEDPNYSDPPIRYVIKERMKCIGTTWWNWKAKRSVGLGFDFDSIVGHAEGVGIPEEELAKLDKIDVDWLEVIRSTSGGSGRHIYIWFDPDNAPVTNTHTEHAALARAFIPLIAKHTGLDIEASVDVCGSVMWIHHSNATKENQGYTLVKPATQTLTADHVPPNWRDNLEVVNGSRAKVRVQGWTSDGTATKGDELDEMTQAHAKIELDETHLKILDALEETGHSSLWVPDHHLWQGHTAGLKYVYDLWAENGSSMRGLFDTNSLDSDPGKPNCAAGDTKVITRQGVKPIRELAGSDAEIITTRGAWVTVPFKSYGQQEVFAVTLKNRERTKVIKATADHRWFVCKYRSHGKRKTKVNFGDRKEVVTTDLEHGQILIQTKPRLDLTPSVVGIQHGMVWGDGTNAGTRITSQLPLFGDKARDFQKFFTEHPSRPITRSVGGVEILNLPYHFKSLVPLSYDKPYIYGWLAGYFATDGCVSEQGSCIIRSADRKSIEHTREICHILGIETTDVTDRYSDNGYIPGIMYTTVLKASDLEDRFFLLKKHKVRFQEATNRQNQYWRVESVEPAGSEEVFCCTVPKTGCFCLEDFILFGNCFMRPKPDGAWDVYRFGEGTDECLIWEQQGKYTHTTYNYPATLKQICLASGGYEGTEEKQGFLFDSLAEMKKALGLLGSKLVLPDKAGGRTLSLHNGPQDKIILVISKERSDTKPEFPRYVKTPRGWEIWIRDSVKTSDGELEEETLWSELDDKMRALKSVGLKGGGGSFDSWVLRDCTEDWTTHPRENLKSYLMSLGFTKPDPILGGAVFKSWILVNEPFQPEYPGGRVWNRDAAQFVYAPVELSEGETPHHPTWTKIMEHCGSDLTMYVSGLPWCKEWGITTGGDYLTAWVACMFQNPFGKLPYLFMYGPQNSGKSTFHEALAFLLTSGVAKADRALTSEQGYNGELMDAVLAVVDEVDISKAGSSVYNKLKEWVTGMTISIHAKYKAVQDVVSTLHFVQMSNSRSSLPVFPGDTRITAMNVPDLDEGQEIAKETLHERLKQEAPHFMRTLMDFEIAEASGRLMLPVIETQGKAEAAAGNIDDVTQFIEDNCFAVPGAAIKFTDFKEKFLDSLEDFQRADWKDRLIRNALSERFPVGRCTNVNQVIIGNLTFSPDAEPGEPFTQSGSKIVKEDEL